jgi:hypothetical protein
MQRDITKALLKKMAAVAMDHEPKALLKKTATVATDHEPEPNFLT